ncbi:MAG: hypothetical protein DME24_18440 [Verrucomicrobia bacterium]|nr:MAG: hypothetical protein DME24_18440 [Verrucomicrobiota bacterium]
MVLQNWIVHPPITRINAKKDSVVLGRCTLSHARRAAQIFQVGRDVLIAPGGGLGTARPTFWSRLCRAELFRGFCGHHFGNSNR